MSIDKQKLQKLLWAEAASFRADGADWKRNTEALQDFLGEKTVEEVALELLAENESLRGSCKAMGADMGKLTRERNSFRSQAEKARAEVAGLRTGYEAYEQVNAELKAEVELLESSRAKLAGDLSRLRAKHKDWSVIAALGQGEQS